MQSIYQKTLSNNLSFEGIGLHSGKKTNLLVKPAKEDVGIVFKRVDLDQNNLVVANYKNVTSAKLCTIKYNGAIAKLTAKGIMFLAGGNTPLFFQDAASFAKFVNTPDTIDANDEESWDATYINEVLDNMFLTPAGRDSDDIQLSLRTIIEKNRTVSRDSTSS